MANRELVEAIRDEARTQNRLAEGRRHAPEGQFVHPLLCTALNRLADRLEQEEPMTPEEAWAEAEAIAERAGVDPPQAHMRAHVIEWLTKEPAAIGSFLEACRVRVAEQVAAKVAGNTPGTPDQVPEIREAYLARKIDGRSVFIERDPYVNKDEKIIVDGVEHEITSVRRLRDGGTTFIEWAYGKVTRHSEWKGGGVTAVFGQYAS